MNSNDEPHYLFLGVGGMGMAPLAIWMSNAGYAVSGHDANLQESVRQHLVAGGVDLLEFVFPEHLSPFSTVVYSSAVRSGHPLLDAARLAGLECVRRGEMLARIASGRQLIAVVGSHGKTTTTGMIAYGMQRLGMDANYILGGLFAGKFGAPSRYSDSTLLLAEIDESDGTIEHFTPEYTLVLNLDWDHADHYPEAAQLEEAFCRLAARTRQKVFLPQSFDPSTWACSKLIHFPIPQGQDFNAFNASAALTLLRHLQDHVPDTLLEGFPGVVRRQSVHMDEPALTVVEDYAHHPTEVAALMSKLRLMAGGRQFVVVFQPHRYTRTQQFKEGFATSLAQVDACYLLPVYAAHEPVLAGGERVDLAAAFRESEPVLLEPTLEGIRQLMTAVFARPSLLAFVGAGDIEDLATATVAMLRRPDRVEQACAEFLQRRLSPEAILKLNEPLANKTTMRIGGPAKVYVEPASLADLQQVLRAAEIFQMDYFCIGRGSNLLVADSGFDGLVIRFASPSWRRIEALGEGRIWVAAGARLKEICGFAAKAGLAGFEFLEGIPGSAGGALRMNAGAMGRWIFDLVERVQFIDKEGVYQDWSRGSFHAGYRRVEEISRGIALGAILSSAEREDESSIRGRIDSYSTLRKESQPRGASAGCIFKNPEGNYAGKLIDSHGLKGLRVGAAMVSEVHANFIVNQGGATAAQVIELIRKIRSVVKSGSGYELEPEVLLLGLNWAEVLREAGDD